MHIDRKQGMERVVDGTRPGDLLELDFTPADRTVSSGRFHALTFGEVSGYSSDWFERLQTDLL